MRTHGQPERRLSELVIAIKGAGEMASAVAWRLHRARFTRLFMMELPQPLAVRRRVSFSEAIYAGLQQVEGIAAVRAADPSDLNARWDEQQIPVLVDPSWQAIGVCRPDVVIDAILAKRNLGTRLSDAPLVVALGPGFVAGVDAHVVVGTNRGHNLGRLFTTGTDEPNTGIPGRIGGYTVERVLRAPCDGPFATGLDIGMTVARGSSIGTVDGTPIVAGVDGIVRGLLRSGTSVRAGLKIGDIDPRADAALCDTISDKARAIAGSVLEALLRQYN